MDKEREDRILEAIGRQREEMMSYMQEKFETIDKKFEGVDKRFENIEGDLAEMKSELNSVKMAVLDNGLNIKELKVEHRELKNSVDTAITNHESRIRRLENKVG